MTSFVLLEVEVAPALRPRPGPLHYFPLTLGLVPYIYRAQLS